MRVPKYHELTLPFLKILRDEKRPLSNSEIKQKLAQKLQLSQEALSESLPAGKNTFTDRVDWAKAVLSAAGLITRPKYGYCTLSDKGERLNLDGIDVINNEFLKQLRLEQEININTDLILTKTYDQTPEEVIDSAFLLMHQSLMKELIEKIKNNTPQFFERLVVDLLVAMGYGGSHKDAAQAIGKTNDGGIDGVISEDRLGLDKIYIQAKRWENTVGRPDIQQFKGALADQVAKKGVFITTSNFSKEAIESARKSGIVLIDGDKLTSLMIEFGLGVQIERSFHIYKIDQDRFDEDNF